MAQMKMKWWIVISGVVVLLIAGAVSATLLFVGRGENANPEEASTASAEQEIATPVVVGPTLYKPIEPPLIVNFNEAAGGARYLQIALEIMAREQLVLDIVEHNMPAIRNNLILLLSDQEPAVLRTREGKDALRESVLAAIQEIVTAEMPAKGPAGETAEAETPGKSGAIDNGPRVEAVYFTKFVMQ